jgi:hypothetical protein
MEIDLATALAVKKNYQNFLMVLAVYLLHFQHKIYLKILYFVSIP